MQTESLRRTRFWGLVAQIPGSGGFLDVRASSVGWLRQEAIGGSKKTVYHEAVSQMPEA